MYRQLLTLLTALAVSLSAYAGKSANDTATQTAELPQAGSTTTVLRLLSAPKGKEHTGIVYAKLDIDPSGKVIGTSWSGTQNAAMLNAAKAQPNRPEKFKPEISCHTEEDTKKCQAVPSQHNALYVFTDKDGNFPMRVRRFGKPYYPPLSQENGEEGTAILTVSFDLDGKAHEVTVKKSSGFPRLDRATIQTVQNATIIPAIVGGQTQQVVLNVPIKFALDEAEKEEAQPQARQETPEKNSLTPKQENKRKPKQQTKKGRLKAKR